MPSFDDLEPWGYGTPPESQLFVYGVDVLVPLVALCGLLGAWWRHRTLAGVCKRWALRVVAGAVVVQLLALPYHLSVFSGVTTTATVVERRHAKATRKRPDEWFVRYQVSAGGRVEEDEVVREDYLRLPEGTVVPVRVSPVETTLGPHATISGWMVMLPALALAVWCGWALYLVLTSRRVKPAAVAAAPRGQ